MDFLDQGNQATLIKQTGSIFLFTSRNVFIMWGILTTTWDSFSWQMMGVLGAHTNGKNQAISSFEEVPENN
jgi:hypothetical protein